MVMVSAWALMVDSPLLSSHSVYSAPFEENGRIYRQDIVHGAGVSSFLKLATLPFIQDARDPNLYSDLADAARRV